jgi:hypothetical protein
VNLYAAWCRTDIKSFLPQEMVPAVRIIPAPQYWMRYPRLHILQFFSYIVCSFTFNTGISLTFCERVSCILFNVFRRVPPTFQRNMSYPSSRSKNKPSKNQREAQLKLCSACGMFHTGVLRGLFFDIFRNVDWLMEIRGLMSQKMEIFVTTIVLDGH